MCCLFGMMDYRGRFSAGEKKRILSVLARECEERGTDATGIAYCTRGHLDIYKRPLPAHRMHFRIPADSRTIMGHTRMTTQGTASRNCNNHPFRGNAGGTPFALAHNGVLWNDHILRHAHGLPETKIETDSYIAVQLLEQQKALDFDSLKAMAEKVEGSFVFTVLDMFIGLVVGALIGIIGNFNALVGEGALTAWGTVSSAAVSTAAIMAVFPKVAGIFASAFTTLTDAYKSKAAKSGEGREWYLSVNDACGYGEPNTLVTGILLIPIMLVVAFILPGNTILPMADLCALPYMVEVFVCVSNGNIAKSVVSGAIWFSLGLVVASVLAPTFTQVAVDAGFQLAQEGVYIISFGIMCHPLIAGLFYAFWSQNPIIIGAVVIAYFVLYFLFKKNKERFVGYLENAAAAYSAY